MGNLIIASSFQAPSAVICSSEDANFPKEWGKYLLWPYRPWKSNAAISDDDWWGVTFAAAKQIDYIFVYGTNVEEVVVEADSENTFDSAAGNPEFSVSPQTLTRDPRDGLYKGWLLAGYGGDYDFDNWRIRSNVSETTDGEKMRIGCAGFLTPDDYDVLTYNPGMPVDWTPRKPTARVGTGEPITVGQRFVNLDLYGTNYRVGTNSEQEFLDLMGLGEGQLIAMFRNRGIASEVYLGHLVGNSKWSENKAGSGTFPSLSFRTVGSLTG